MAPPYTNQHYVPESYLRGWTYEGTDHVSIYLTGPEREIPNQPIDEICSSKDFNSGYKPLEIMLGRLESAHAAAFNRIRKGHSLRSLTEGERNLLLSFSVTQRMRSKAMRSEIEELGQSLISKALEKDIPELGLDVDKFREKWESQSESEVLANHHSQMMHGILAPIGMHKLEAVVLENTSDEPFITSEAPVIFENSRFKKERGMNYPGMSDAGLQIYCPLSPSVCLFLYDPETYSVDSRENGHAKLNNPQDVRELNILQVLATESFLIYQETDRGEKMVSLIEEARQYEDWDTVELEYSPIIENSEAESYSYTPQHQLHDLILTLEPVSQDPGAEYRQRRDAETLQRNLVHKIHAQTDFTERAVINAIVFILKKSGVDPMKGLGLAESD